MALTPAGWGSLEEGVHQPLLGGTSAPPAKSLSDSSPLWIDPSAPVRAGGLTMSGEPTPLVLVPSEGEQMSTAGFRIGTIQVCIWC